RAGGRGQHFEGGSLYSAPTSGTWVVKGAIRDLWASTGWEAGWLGYPIGDERAAGADGSVRAQSFQGGTAYWSPAGGAHAVRGAIGAAFEAWGGATGVLGLPVGEEFGPLRDGGFGQHFQRGELYWSPATGARFVDEGPIREYWARNGWEAGWMGYPTTDATTPYHEPYGPFVHVQQFQGAAVYQSKGGTRAVRGAILEAYRGIGGDRSALGMPVGDEHADPDGRVRQEFFGGTITWSPAEGAVVALTRVM
ncbi:LGFP repeat-containing protein, partial [Kineococcus glutinatus]|uniref:LGFP repeat-containing protein n=1 Tax=Kineococcus glutinatus TaxID=1070872 RepID=UPI003CD058CD